MPVFDAIFFDVGSTLIPSAKIIHQAAGTACQKLAQSGLLPEARSFFLGYLQADARVNPQHISHIYSDILIVEEAGRVTGLPMDLRRTVSFLSAYRDALRAQIKPSKKIVQLFQTLQNLGIHRGIISDGSAEGQGEVLARLGLLPLISPGLLFISGAAGCTKDNPEIYRRAVAAASVSAERALMIGDRIDVDVAVPQSVGMKAVLLRAHPAPPFVPAGLTHRYAAVRPEEVFESWGKLDSWLKRRVQ